MSVRIILTTNSSYIDVCETFFCLKDNNWHDCPYNITMSYFGKKISDCKCIEGDVLYNGLTSTLPTCIYNAAMKYYSDYYICFLGDAFFYRKTSQDLVDKILDEIEKNNIDYCNLIEPPYDTDRQYRYKYIRSLSYKDRGVSFVAFAASRRFIENEFSNGITDYEFEVKYLKYTYSCKTPEEWMRYNFATLIDNKMNIAPGIDKGMWDRDSFRLIKKYNNIDLPKRKLIPLYIYLVRKIAYAILGYIPTKYTKKIKGIISKFNIYEFSSNE